MKMINTWTLNTSNPGKQREYRRLFANRGIDLRISHIDVKEIDADPLSVAVHKASQFDQVLVEDTSLDVEDAPIGIHIRGMLSHLKQYVGKKATWNVFLAYKSLDLVHVFRGTVRGEIVLPRGHNGFDFDPYFVPEGVKLTLAQSKPDELNARAHAVQDLLNNKCFATQKAITEWKGPWQRA